MKKTMTQIERIDAEIQRLEEQVAKNTARRDEIGALIADADAAAALGETPATNTGALERELAVLLNDRAGATVEALRSRRRQLVEALPEKVEAELTQRKDRLEAEAARRFAKVQELLDKAAELAFADPPLFPIEPHVTFLQRPAQRERRGTPELTITQGRFMLSVAERQEHPLREQGDFLQNIRDRWLREGDAERAARRLMGLPIEE